MIVKNASLLVLFICTIFSNISAQDDLAFNFSTDIFIEYPYLSVPRSTVESASTFRDLNRHHKSDWIASYKSVEVITYHNGVAKTTPGVDSTLTAMQKELISTADYGSEISVNVRYMPKNKFSRNEVHDMNFKFTVDPDKPASFKGGEEELNAYLNQHVIEKLSMNSFRPVSYTHLTLPTKRIV